MPTARPGSGLPVLVPIGSRIVEIWHPGEVATHRCDYVTSVSGGTGGIARRGTVWMKIPGGVIPPVPKFGGPCGVHRQPAFNSQGFPMNCGRFVGNEPLRWRFNDPPVVYGEPCAPYHDWPLDNWRWTRQGDGAVCDPRALVWVPRLQWDGSPFRLA